MTANKTAEFQSWLPFYTLLKREVLRFLSVAAQTLITPVITASLYLLVFGMSLGSKIDLFPEFTYTQFVVPGLILMGVMNQAFANTSSSIFIYRYFGSIVDLLVTPLTAPQFIFAFTLAAMLRGVLVGIATWLISLFFTGLPWAHPGLAAVMLLLGAFLFAQFGIIAAIYSKNFDALSMFTNFLILPLIYTGGLFYPVSHLPPFWQTVSLFNPLAYLIDGFRQTILGFGSFPLWLDFAVAGLFSVAFFVWAWGITKSGRGLRT
jgi:ABC-2 type transport system permease protein